MAAQNSKKVDWGNGDTKLGQNWHKNFQACRSPAAPHPIIYTSSTKAKIVSKFCKISKTLGKAVPSTSPLYHGDMNLGVR